MSAGIRITASRLSGGESAFENVTSLRIYADLDSPAQSLSAALAVPEPPPALGEAKAYEGDKLLFSGKIDSQRLTVSKDGILLRLDARSKGALLLDNQALPCVMLGAQVTAVFNRFIAPYGFVLYNPNRSSYLPMYTVRAGESEWDAFVNFTRRVFNVTPYVKASQVILERPRSQAPLTISNSGEGVPYISLAHTRTPYNILSKIILRDENGLYSSAVHNSAAAYTQSVRKRYVIPPSEYVDFPGLDANRRIRRSMYEYEQVVASLPGAVDAELARDVLIRDKYLRLSNLMVSGREYLADESGLITKLTLASSAYYD